MSYKATLITNPSRSQKSEQSVEVFELQCSFPLHKIQPSEDFRRVVEESSAEINQALREVMTRDS